MFLTTVLATIDWLKIKLSLQNKKAFRFFNEGEIWWCNIGMNLGTEIFGKGKDFTRPVLIAKKLSANSFLGIPLTTNPKDGTWYVPIVSGGKEARAVLSQARVMDRIRLADKIETLSSESLVRVRRALADLYGP